MSAKSPGLEAELRARIAADGPLGFDEFMAAALYHPAHGYYCAEVSRTGRRGDYFTSVSVGPVFGRLLAAQFAQMWRELGRPENFALVEQGANDGRLMDDILAAIQRDHPEFHPQAMIVEPLPARRAAQQDALRHWQGCIEWVGHEKDLPDFVGVFFANELLDAFPVKLFVRESNQWLERRVGCDGDRFVFRQVPLRDPAWLDAVQALPIPDDILQFSTEICPSLGEWMSCVAAKLSRGWMLLVDYGHPAAARFHSARAGGTLAAYRDHARRENPLDTPGAQDLTTHVDFTALARASAAAGLQLAGFTDQHHALAALAATAFPPMAPAPLDSEAAKEMRALRQLLHPDIMGTAFKFLAFSKGADAPLAAFRFARDARHELFG